MSEKTTNGRSGGPGGEMGTSPKAEALASAPLPIQQSTDDDALLERVCRAMVAASRPMADPDKLVPAPRGSVGWVPIWRTYEHLARAAMEAVAHGGRMQ